MYSRVDSASNRNEYQESSWGEGGKGRTARKPGRLTTLWDFTACYRDSFTLPDHRDQRIQLNLTYMHIYINSFVCTTNVLSSLHVGHYPLCRTTTTIFFLICVCYTGSFVFPLVYCALLLSGDGT
jgi:hypothetical protein